MFINNIDINIRSYKPTTHGGNIATFGFFYSTIFKDYMTGLEVLARLRVRKNTESDQEYRNDHQIGREY